VKNYPDSEQLDKEEGMKVKGISWIGVLTDDYDKSRNFWGNVLGLDQEWMNSEKGNSFFRFPNGQEVEVYSAANRLRKEKYKYFKGPVLGIEVENIEAARREMIAHGFEFITEIESTEDGKVCWAYFIGPDGYLYSLHEHFE
jgi:catechol 2,3-dioxygenase-like lactoylglutathione lyase family enzyme